MGTAVWIGVGVAAWLALAIPVAVCIGRAIRLRDEQSPRGDAGTPRPNGARATRPHR